MPIKPTLSTRKHNVFKYKADSLLFCLKCFASPCHRWREIRLAGLIPAATDFSRSPSQCPTPSHASLACGVLGLASPFPLLDWLPLRATFTLHTSLESLLLTLVDHYWTTEKVPAEKREEGL